MRLLKITILLLFTTSISAQINERADEYPNGHTIKELSTSNSTQNMIADMFIKSIYGNTLSVKLLNDSTETNNRADGYPNGHSIDQLGRPNSTKEMIADMFVTTPFGNALAVKIIGENSGSVSSISDSIFYNGIWYANGDTLVLEKQQISISNDTIYLSDGGFVVIPILNETRDTTIMGLDSVFIDQLLNSANEFQSLSAWRVGVTNVSSNEGEVLYVNGINTPRTNGRYTWLDNSYNIISDTTYAYVYANQPLAIEIPLNARYFAQNIYNTLDSDPNVAYGNYEIYSVSESNLSFYNQSLNTSDNVEFNSIETNALQFDLPLGGGTAPAGLQGTIWGDTTTFTLKFIIP